MSLLLRMVPGFAKFVKIEYFKSMSYSVAVLGAIAPKISALHKSLLKFME